MLAPQSAVADDMSAAVDHHQPDPASLRDPAPMLRARIAVQSRAQAEADVATAVTDMRNARYPGDCCPERSGGNQDSHHNSPDRFPLTSVAPQPMSAPPSRVAKAPD